jgi:phosphoribosylformylglycinamidine cyclo-ligase
VSPGASDPPTSYQSAGVSIDAGERAVELMRVWVEQARRPEVLGGIGGFAGLYDASALTLFRHPLLATSADGVGTKVLIAQRMDRHDTIGIDLVGMLVDDLVACGAEPLYLTDYVACGRVVPERVAAIVKGVAEGCIRAGCALLGGETAEHPGVLEPDEYDLAGSTTGVVEAADLLGPGRVEAGDAVLAMRSSGLHSNGYSLVRHVVFDLAGWQLDRDVPELGGTLGDALLTPTSIYAKPCLELARSTQTHALAHVTGGGLAANLARVLPSRLVAEVERSTWSPQPVFGLIGELGGVPLPELEATLNMGVGMVAVVAAADADRGVALLGDAGLDAWVCGAVRAAPQAAASTGTATDSGSVRLHGRYAG